MHVYVCNNVHVLGKKTKKLCLELFSSYIFFEISRGFKCICVFVPEHYAAVQSCCSYSISLYLNCFQSQQKFQLLALF